MILSPMILSVSLAAMAREEPLGERLFGRWCGVVVPGGLAQPELVQVPSIERDATEQRSSVAERPSDAVPGFTDPEREIILAQ